MSEVTSCNLENQSSSYDILQNYCKYEGVSTKLKFNFMGEKRLPPKENRNNSGDKMNETINGSSENPNGEENMDTNSENNDDENENENEENEDMTPEEFAALDNQLDALNSALDDIEQKNDDIHAQLLQLLHANREIRQQLQQGNIENQTDLNLSKEPM